ncbi:MAG: 3D domain-containing protein [Bilophila wadsworthia]
MAARAPGIARRSAPAQSALHLFPQRAGNLFRQHHVRPRGQHGVAAQFDGLAGRGPHDFPARFGACLRCEYSRSSSPVEEGPVSTTPLFGIGLAQDTGEAIKGRRVDLFCGKGARAAYIAGHLNGPGEIWMLLAK